MEPRVSLIRLGAADFWSGPGHSMKRSGFEPPPPAKAISYFQAGGLGLAIFPGSELAHDVGIDAAGGGFRGITPAHNVRIREEVAVVLEKARAAGAEIVKLGQDAVWGGHSGHFADPDGRLWEVAWNPYIELRQDGAFVLPDEG